MVELFRQLKDLSIEQSKAIENNKAEELAGLVAEKQKIIDQIEGLKYRTDISLSSEDREKITSILSEQAKIEKDNERKLKLLIAKLGKNVAGIAKGKSAAKSYSGQKIPAVSRFLDIAK